MGSGRIRISLLSLWMMVFVSYKAAAQEHRELTAVVGNTVTLPCSVPFVGEQTVIWKDPHSNMLTINEQRVTDDSRISVSRPYVREWNLQIEHIEKRDQGTYTCKIQSAPDRLVTLLIHFPPKITDSSQREVVAKPHADVVFMCNATGFPDPHITWYKYNLAGERKEIIPAGDKAMEDEELVTGNTTLYLKNVSEKEGGTYECEANNGISPADRKTFKLDIRFLPQIRLPYEKISQSMGKETLLQCIITANPVNAHYWQRNGQRLVDSDKYRVHVWEVDGYTRTLGAYVSDLNEDDFGEYMCVAENELGRVEDKVFLYEWRAGEVRVLSTPRDVISHAGRSVLFNCTVEGLSDRDTLIWWKHSPTMGYSKIFVSNPASEKKGDVTYLDSDKYEIKGHYNLLVKDVSMREAGMYICEVTGHKNYTATLTVADSLHCTSNGSVSAGQQAFLLCSLTYHGPQPEWRTDWQHGDRRLSSVQDDDYGILRRYVAFPASLTDSGTYSCILSSKTPKFTDKCTTTLSVRAFEGTTSPVCRDTSNMVEVTMVIGIIGAGAGTLLLLFICILIAVVINFKRQLSKYHRVRTNVPSSNPPKAKKAKKRGHSPRSVRYKNGSLSLETDALTVGGHGDHTEVDV